jgi:hypothetical protein
VLLTYDELASSFITLKLSFLDQIDPDDFHRLIERCSSTYKDSIKKHSDLIEKMKLIPALPYVLIFVCYMSVLSAPFVPQRHFGTYINCLFSGFIVAAGLPIVHFCGLFIGKIIAHALSWRDLHTLLRGENKCRFEHRGFHFSVHSSLVDVVRLRYSTIHVNKLRIETVFKKRLPGFADVKICNTSDNRVVLII